MPHLTLANHELFRRTPDECFPSLEALYDHCRRQRDASQDLWERPQSCLVTPAMTLRIGESAERPLNDWSFSQLCRMAGVSKDTINRLSPSTASKALQETLPAAEKPLQILATGDMVRSVHGVAYTRLWNAELLDVVFDQADGFEPPQEAMTGGTGLYCGEQDMFCFLIDPTGWAEIDGEAFAPGFFLWNSEVGRRSLGIQTFWFQKICRNHIVWDAVEVVEFKRKHTANVRDGLDDIRRIIDTLVAKRDERRDSFVKVIRKAMTMKMGECKEDMVKALIKEGIPASITREAMEIARDNDGYTIFALVDALTRVTQKIQYAGDRMEADAKVSALLALAV